ncbi:hypothetical protein ACTFQF_00440 [Aliivibrio fischeri]|uniref:Uncharacterized protein n=1 Tax=Aliivibrio fischeri (strain MJ11) TaxID=388396 RepID=B5EVX1_ALIFM|nr:hypothetical protein [Aliivibrio fischeri]ACH64652.1 hypothetical protein VFMJ11_B0028 [Aliivibrio fischeri MJ11]MUK37524.1 hypothetical protein [Aliivibrio fischeri]
MSWTKLKCECGLGEHFRYERSDGGIVTRDHGCDGQTLKSNWIGSSEFLDEQIKPHKTAQAAMDKVDKLYPIQINKR